MQSTVDTNTPGYEEEMKTKPEITKKLSESGSVFSAEQVAKDIVACSTQGYFAISTGLDGWLLKHLHPGMSPISNGIEVLQQVFFCPIRLIAVAYISYWNSLVKTYVQGKDRKAKEEKSS